ncbi:MAG TPA: peptidylprolyl isomerase [Deltaproteobacteria bacterium]|nr:peptidylprolyl isomerase [Deltaproteobacteria bacterium]
MQAKTNDTVKVHYKGSLRDGTVFDSSLGKDPFVFVIGEGSVIPGFEKSVVGMCAGDTKIITLPPEEGYGLHREELCAVVTRSRIPNTINLRQGMKLEVQSSSGSSAQALVLQVTDSDVTLDLNHPLAGKELVFELELIEILKTSQP